MHTLFMGKRLRDVVERFLTKEGPAGKAALSAAVGRHPATIDRWIKNGCPTPHDAYQLALACGCGERAALLIGKECFTDEAKETA